MAASSTLWGRTQNAGPRPKAKSSARGRPRVAPDAARNHPRAPSSPAPERRAQGRTQKHHPPSDRSVTSVNTIYDCRFSEFHYLKFKGFTCWKLKCKRFTIKVYVNVKNIPFGVSKLLLNTATQQNHIRQSMSIRRSAKNARQRSLALLRM